MDEFSRGSPASDREELRRYDLISAISSGVIAELDKRMEIRLRPMIEKVDKLWDERNEERGSAAAEKRFQAVLVGVSTIFATIIAAVGAVVIQHYLH